MKRRVAIWLCASTLSMSTFALAQGSVTLTGMIDGGITYVNNQHGSAVTLFDSGVFAPDLLTINGTEDLGGGIKALFELTSQFELDGGSTIPGPGQIFNRTALVGVESHGLGTLTLGTQYDFMFESLTAAKLDAAFLFGGIYDFRQGPYSALGVPNNPTGSFDFDRMAGATRVPKSVKYRSPKIGGLSLGALYGFGGVPGSLPSDSTKSFGVNYSKGPVGFGAAFVDVRYPQLGNGHDGIRNFGLGANYQFERLLAMLLYTNTTNTATSAKIDVYKIAAMWNFAAPWTAGLAYTYMEGNAVLQNNRAHQLTGAVQYHLSKRTTAYVEAICQRASGNGAVTRAWINGLPQPDGAASNRSQTLVRIGLATRF